MTDDIGEKQVLDVLGDENAREILALVNQEARSAKSLAEKCGVSLPTIYRRLEVLEDCDLVKTRSVVGENGNQYSVYASNFDSTIVSLEGATYDVQLFRKQKLPDRFSKLWDDLQAGAAAES